MHCDLEICGQKDSDSHIHNTVLHLFIKMEMYNVELKCCHFRHSTRVSLELIYIGRTVTRQFPITIIANVRETLNLIYVLLSYLTLLKMGPQFILTQSFPLNISFGVFCVFVTFAVRGCNIVSNCVWFENS